LPNKAADQQKIAAGSLAGRRGKSIAKACRRAVQTGRACDNSDWKWTDEAKLGKICRQDEWNRGTRSPKKSARGTARHYNKKDVLWSFCFMMLFY